LVSTGFCAWIALRIAMTVLKRIARNLYTQTIGNSCVWVFRYRINGRSRAMGLGSVEIVPPSVAKRKALEFRAMLMEGRDPPEERGRVSRRRLPTFAELAAEYIRDHAPRGETRNPSSNGPIRFRPMRFP
jgi:hypothetical protein